ncbi:MAG: hypothetical protein WCG80_12960 [Spirochaetales bacterium]
MSPNTDASLPLIFAVTGHRDLREADLAGLKATTVNLFREYQERYPHTRLRLLSGLAEGADQLVAQAALACGVELVAVLPVPRIEYEKDFDPAGIAVLHSFLERSVLTIELPQDKLPENRYVPLAAYLADHCHILLALWNGKNNHEPGGTANVVEFQLDGVPSRWGSHRGVLETPDFGAVFHVFAARDRHDREVTTKLPAPEVPCVQEAQRDYDILLPASWEGPKVRHTFGNFFGAAVASLDQFNVALADRLEPAEVKRNAGYLITPSQEGLLTPGLRKLWQWAAQADTLAQGYQTKAKRTVAALFLLAAAAFSMLSLFVDLNPLGAVIATALVLVLAGLAVSFWANRSSWNDRYIDSRALAEGLRVQLYWRLAGVKQHVGDVYLQKYRGNLEWILMALRSADLEAEEHGRKQPEPTEVHRDAATAGWVKDQAKYFARTTATRERQGAFRSRVTGTLFALSLAAFLGILGLQVAHLLAGASWNWQDFSAVMGSDAYFWLLFLFDLLLGLGTALAGYAEVTGQEEEERQYRRMSQLFARGNQLLERAGSQHPSEFQNILLALGTEALAESGDWLAGKKANPIVMPLA